jgi:protein TonB
MELQSILSADYLDIIFDNRNKNYGGYELRKHYNHRAMKAITVVLSTALLLLGAHAFASRFKPTDVVKLSITDRVYEMQDLTPDVPDPPLPEPPPEPVAPPPTQAWTPPVIVDDIDVVEPPPTQDDLKDKAIGTTTIAGDPGNDDLNPPITGRGKTGGGFTEPPPVIEDRIETYVEQMPEFEGSISEYLSRNIQYPELAKQTNTSGRVVIKFVVNEDGSISNTKVVKGIGAGCEEEAMRVINSMPKWKAGKTNGKAVKVYFTLPVSFKLN